MSGFVLKIIAVFFMVVDHVKYAFPTCYNEFTLYFGRIAFPLFAFCAVQSYIHTSNLKNYLNRLLIAGIVSEIPFLLFCSLPTLKVVGLDIQFTLFMGILAIILYDNLEDKRKSLFLVLIIAILSEIIKVDYGLYGALLVFSFYIFKDSKWKTLLSSGLVVCLHYLYRFVFLNSSEYTVKNWICSLIPLFIILLYNGKKGHSMKWFFYIFYPLHLLIFYLLSPYTFNLLNL